MVEAEIADPSALSLRHFAATGADRYACQEFASLMDRAAVAAPQPDGASAENKETA